MPLLTLYLAATLGHAIFVDTNTQIIDSMKEATKAGRFAEIEPGLRRLKDLSGEETQKLGDFLNGTLVNQLETKDRDLMLKTIRVAFELPVLKDPQSVIYWQTKSTEARVLEVLSKHDEAVATLDAAMSKTSSVGKDILGRLRQHLALVGTPAPAISSTHQMGRFPGLDKWKGKVVILDFFAHWCGPCIAEFPEMKGIYEDFHSSGLEILGATELYGYYGARKGLSESEELGEMKRFAKEHQLPWPIVFTTKSVKSDYRELGLPNVVVVDRKGIIREVGYGFFPGEAGKLRRLVETLMKE